MGQGFKKKYNKRVDGLKPKMYRKNIQWAVDMDYVSSLIETAKHSTNPAEKLEAIEALHFLSQFLTEYYDSGYLKDKDAIHGKKLRIAIYNAMNASNRDLYSIKNSGGAIDHIDYDQYTESPEDALIEMIDVKKAANDD